MPQLCPLCSNYPCCLLTAAPFWGGRGSARRWPPASLPGRRGGEGEDETSNEEGRRVSWQLLDWPDMQVCTLTNISPFSHTFGSPPTRFHRASQRSKRSFIKWLLSFHFQRLYIHDIISCQACLMTLVFSRLLFNPPSDIMHRELALMSCGLCWQQEQTAVYYNNFGGKW